MSDGSRKLPFPLDTAQTRLQLLPGFHLSFLWLSFHFLKSPLLVIDSSLQSSFSTYYGFCWLLSALFVFWRPWIMGGIEISPGKAIYFPAYPCRIYVRSLSIRVLDFVVIGPLVLHGPPNSVFVHQGSVLLPASFRFHLTVDTLAFR